MIGGTCGLVAILFAMCIWCKWDDLKLAIEIVNASADFLAQTKRLLATPLVYFVFLFIFFLFWLSCIICVMSMGKITPEPDQNDPLKPWIPLYKDVDWGDRKDTGKIANYMLAFLCFGLIWTVFFLQASSNYVVMVTAATYYFTSNVN